MQLLPFFSSWLRDLKYIYMKALPAYVAHNRKNFDNAFSE